MGSFGNYLKPLHEKWIQTHFFPVEIITAALITKKHHDDIWWQMEGESKLGAVSTVWWNAVNYNSTMSYVGNAVEGINQTT